MLAVGGGWVEEGGGVLTHLILGVPGRGLAVAALVERSNLRLAAVVLAAREVVEVGNLRLARVVLGVGELIEGGDLLLATVVLALGPAVHRLDLLLPVREQHTNNFVTL